MAQLSLLGILSETQCQENQRKFMDTRVEPQLKRGKGAYTPPFQVKFHQALSQSYLLHYSVLPEGDSVNGILLSVLHRNHFKGFILPLLRVLSVIMWEFAVIEKPWVVPTLKKRRTIRKWWQKKTEATDHENANFRIILPFLRTCDMLESATSKHLETLFIHRQKSVMISGIKSHSTTMLKFYLLLVREHLSLCAHSGTTKKGTYWVFTKQSKSEWHYWYTSQKPVKLSRMKGIGCPRDDRFQRERMSHHATQSTWSKNWFTKESQNFPGAE